MEQGTEKQVIRNFRTPNDFKSRKPSLGLRLLILSVGSALISSVALLLIAVNLSDSYAALARSKVDELILQDLNHITTGVYHLVQSEGDSFSAELLRSLRVARAFLDKSGSVSFGPSTVNWNSINQFSGKMTSVNLPKMFVGGRWLGQNADPKISSPLVDEISGLLGITVTLFQRMNAQGDMLRVSTTVPKKNGDRAIGTYIPAVMSDGSPNPVVATILKGDRFVGRAVVVDDWYLTAYEPLRTADGAIVGMLYVGERQAAIESHIRSAILGTRIGESGYVFVISGRGDRRGRYIISQDGKRDGEDIWDIVDSNGRYVTRDVVDAALSLLPGQFGTITYRWKNQGELDFRVKIARVAYYAPWDWVIGTTAYEDELGQYRIVLDEGRRRMLLLMTMTGIVIMLFVGAFAFLVSRSIARPLAALAGAAREYTRGDGWKPVAAANYEEVMSLSEAFNAMAERIRDTMQGLRSSEEKYRGVYENALEGILRTTLDGKVLGTNPAMAKMLGFASPDEAMLALNEIQSQAYVQPEDRNQILSDIQELGASEGREFQFKKVGGPPFWVSVNAWALRGEDGSVQGIEGLVTDIDERKKSEETLRATLVQKESLLREVHHRVKNNLQLLVSLLGLETTFSTDAEAITVLGDFADRVRAMYQIHELVYDSVDLDSVDMYEYARLLAGTLYQTHRDRFTDVDIVIEGRPFLLSLDKAVPCGLLLNEIISNAFLHAFPPKGISKGRIRIEFHTDENGPIEFSVSDNGIGLPEEIGPGDGGRLGMMLIPGLSRQIGTDMVFERRPETIYRFRFIDEFSRS
ncbi:MAG: Cache 3/Cache 2 fusion domain-containing protein [Treponemataceae bacterium]